MPAGALLAASEPAARVALLPAVSGTTSASGGSGTGCVVLQRVVAASASNTVHVAVDGGRPVIIKTANSSAAGTGLRREYNLGMALNHRHLIKPRSWYADAPWGGIVFDYLSGGDLTQVAGFSPRYWQAPLVDVAEALEYLHRQGLAHRDVKARNVRLDEHGRATLVDLGSAEPFGSTRRHSGTTAATRLPAGVAMLGSASSQVGAADDVYAYALLVEEMMEPSGCHLSRADALSLAPLRRLAQSVRREPLRAPLCRLRDFRRLLVAINPAGAGPGR